MALTSNAVYDYEIVGDFRFLNVKTITIYKDNDVEVARNFHRGSYAPTTDPAILPTDEARALAAVAWTQEVKDAYEAQQAAIEAEQSPTEPEPTPTEEASE